MPSTFRAMITAVRIPLRDMRVRMASDPEIAQYLNEGKNELVKVIRQANENFFQTSTSTTISTTTAPNPSIVSLPTDFAELRNLKVTNVGYEDIAFEKMSQSDNRFKQALIDGGNFASGRGLFFYDFVASTIRFSPGADIDLGLTIEYIQTISDMTLPDDYPTGIPTEHSDFMVTWATRECLRSIKDPRKTDWDEKIDEQGTRIIESVNTRQIREPKFVIGFMEEEYWG